MAAFTALAIAAGLGAAGLLAAKNKGDKSEEGNVANRRTRTATNTNPPPTTGQIGTGGDSGGRRRPPDAPVIGQAVPRNPTGGTADATSTSVPTPPTAAPDAGQAAGMAAATKARKAGAGASVLTGLPVNKGAAGRLRPKSLIGY